MHLFLILVLLALITVPAPARADMIDDCQQKQSLWDSIFGRHREINPDQVISGCTAVINSGRWSGADLAWAYYNRGNAHAELGDLRRAIADFDRALGLDPHHSPTYYNRSNSYANLGDYERAIADYADAIRLEPNHCCAHNNLAWVLYLDGRPAEGLPHVDRSLRLEPNNTSVLGTRAHILTALGRADEALAEFERAMEAGGADRVRAIQEALTRHGYDPGPVDGTYRPETQAALAACLQAGCRLLD